MLAFLLAVLERPTLACSPEQVAAIEAALQSAPVSSAPLGEEASAPAAEVAERRCGPSQAQAIRRVLDACQPTEAQAVLYLGAGRCLQQAGLTLLAARDYRAYLAMQDQSASPERAAERRERVRRWLQEMGEPVPPGATLLLRSNLRGALVTHLDGIPDGLTIDQGDNRILQPPGRRNLSLALRGFARVELPVELIEGESSRAEVDWRRYAAPPYTPLLLSHWDDFARSGLTPAGYADKRRRPLSAVLSALVAAAGATLIGICAANVNSACDAGWKEGLAYGGGALLAGSGIVGLITALTSPYEALPLPGVPQASPFDSPAPAAP